MVPEGQRLKRFIETHNYGPADVVKKGVYSNSNLHNIFNRDKLKRSVVEKILKSLDLSPAEFYEGGKDPELTTVNEGSPLYAVLTHQGRNLQHLLETKNIRIKGFAHALKVSPPTLYKYFKEKELPLGMLLEAAYVLGVPVAAIKGHGTGEKSFEKDVYLELKSINEKLSKLLSIQKVANAS